MTDNSVATTQSNPSDIRIESSNDSQNDIFGQIPPDELYKEAIKCYKEKEKSGELSVEYPLRLQFMAYSKQAKHGDYKDNAADYGWFDFVGNDVSKAWRKVSETHPGKEQAMLEFVRLLDAICPTFRNHVNEKMILHNDKTLKRSPSLKEDVLDSKLTDAVQRLHNFVSVSAESASKEAVTRKLIQEALNKQTFHQFLAYAQQTHPGDQDKQEQLIKQLQEQHYEQYMSQVYARQAQVQAASIEASAYPTSDGDSTTDSDSRSPAAASYMHEGLQSPTTGKSKVRNVDEHDANGDDDSDVSNEDLSEEPSNPKISPASMWTTATIKEFKGTIQKEGPEGVLKISHGEIVTVRVPTHPDGNSLFWEFATDYYDIGFGVYFEWTIAESSAITVHVEESDAECEEGVDAEETLQKTTADLESGEANGATIKQHDPTKPRTDEIIPIFRRDSHQEVIAGSHVYPGTGVYLLKFDNSYSLWRSKNLYFRVYFSKA